MAKCWRFSGKGVGNNDYYEHFACGNNAEFRLSNPGTGRRLFMDGIDISPSNGYEYATGTNQVTTVDTPIVRNSSLPSGNSTGNCNNCPSVPTQGWCVRGNAVAAPNRSEAAANYYNTEPQITHRSSPADESFWGFKYSTINGIGYVDGTYTITRSDQASCTVTPANIKHDCINGQCVPSTRFTTPGIYNSLEDCQVQCELNNTDLVCLTPSEYNQITALIRKISQEIC